MTPRSSSKSDSAANLGFEAKLWLAADKLRNNMDAAEYKHVVLGLIFLKYISDTFEEHRAKLAAGKGDYAGANPEDQDEYKAENVFWVPPAARWSTLQNSAKQPTIGTVVDDAMVAIERDNPRLKGVLPKEYARPGLDKHRLGELIDLIGTITLGCSGAVSASESSSDGESATVTDRRYNHRSVDLLGRVYEYFLTRFASAEGRGEVRSQIYEGRTRPQRAHQAVCAANHPVVRKPAEIDRGTGSRKQLLRSGTSVGANYREAHRGRSKAEFIAKCGDSLRELEESAYWLELLVDGEIVPAVKLQPLRSECDELTAIFVTIIKKAREGGSRRAE